MGGGREASVSTCPSRTLLCSVDFTCARADDANVVVVVVALVVVVVVVVVVIVVVIVVVVGCLVCGLIHH